MFFLQGLKFNFSFSKLELASSFQCTLSAYPTNILSWFGSLCIVTQTFFHQENVSRGKCLLSSPTHTQTPSHADPVNLQVQHFSVVDREGIPLQNAPNPGYRCMWVCVHLTRKFPHLHGAHLYRIQSGTACSKQLWLRTQLAPLPRLSSLTFFPSSRGTFGETTQTSFTSCTSPFSLMTYITG